MAFHTGENRYIYGLHDRGGEHLLMDGNEAKGWVLVTEKLGHNPNDGGGGNYKDLEDKGLGVIIRLNNDYGPNGTVPHSSKYDDFAKRVANFVAGSTGGHIWLIGNEMNFEREQPRGERLTPRLYAECYKKCRKAIKSVPGHENDLVVVGAIGPWNAETPYDADPQGKYRANKIAGAPGHYPYEGFFGDYIQYFRDMLTAIGRENCDAIAIHAYSHGYSADLVFSDEKMGPPFQNYHYHFRTYKDQMNAIPSDMRDLPVYLTEANGDKEGQGEPNNSNTWPFGNNGWIKNAYKEIDSWNKAGNQQIRCVILFRWMLDPHGWSIEGKEEVQKDLREAVERNYRWNPDIRPRIGGRGTPASVPSGPAITVPTTTGIQIQNITAQLPANPNVPAYGTRPKSAIKRVIIHHTAVVATVGPQRIAQVQTTRANSPLPGISYHFCVGAQGEVYQTQALETVSTHAGNSSSDSVGIGLLGNFMDSPPTGPQLGATAALIAHLAQELNFTPNLATVYGYSDIVATGSPGATWPQWKDSLIATAAQLAGSGGAVSAVTPSTPDRISGGQPLRPVAPSEPGYLAKYIDHNTPVNARVNQTLTVNITVQNAGTFTWQKGGRQPFHLGFKWFDQSGQFVSFPSRLDYRTTLPKNVSKGQSVTLRARLRTPSTPGTYRLQWDMVQEQVTWFSDQGDPGLVINNIIINPAGTTTTPTVTRPTVTTPTISGGQTVQIQDISASLPSNPNVAPYPTRSKSVIRRFILSHTATPPSVSPQRIAQFQTADKNMPGIGYHYCVMDDGQVYQTQPLEVVANHSGPNSADSVGICLIGNFTSTPPPDAQRSATAALIAQVAAELGLAADDSTIFGYSDVENTRSPGDTWPNWKNALIIQAHGLRSGNVLSATPAQPATPVISPPVSTTLPAGKVIEHYLLLWHNNSDSWAEIDLVSAIDYIGAFRPTVGFSVEQAKLAKYVTIVGGVGGVSAEAEQTLRRAGCQVERLDGATEAETNQMLYDLVASGRRFRTLA